MRHNTAALWDLLHIFWSYLQYQPDLRPLRIKVQINSTTIRELPIPYVFSLSGLYLARQPFCNSQLAILATVLASELARKAGQQHPSTLKAASQWDAKGCQRVLPTKVAKARMWKMQSEDVEDVARQVTHRVGTCRTKTCVAA